MDFQILAKGIALAGCAIGAGCSLIAACILVSVKEMQWQKHWKQSDGSRNVKAMLQVPCCLDAQSQRPRVSMVL